MHVHVHVPHACTCACGRVCTYHMCTMVPRQVHLEGISHLEPPLSIGCHYQLKACTGAKFQLVEDWGAGYRAEVLISRWAAAAQVRILAHL